ncbi:MAG TPA: hypothetical protein VEL76_32040 [Gemmataceae bacterium]|nr:hypothetical protein [Gemmataceae bacterium]
MNVGTVEDVVPLDPSLVKGSHGLPVKEAEDRPISGERVEGGWRSLWYSGEGTSAVDFDGEHKVQAVWFVPLVRGQRGGLGP